MNKCGDECCEVCLCKLDTTDFCFECEDLIKKQMKGEEEKTEEIIVINGVDVNSLSENEEDIHAETKKMKHLIVNASSDFSPQGNINDLKENLKEIFTQKIIDEIPDFDLKKYVYEGCKISVIVRTSFPPGVLDDN